MAGCSTPSTRTNGLAKARRNIEESQYGATVTFREGVIFIAYLFLKASVEPSIVLSTAPSRP